MVQFGKRFRRLDHSLQHRLKNLRQMPRPKQSVVPQSKKNGKLLLIVLGVIVALTTTAIVLTPEPAADLFWQLRCGNDIIASGILPHHDSYSWTRHGAPWSVNEWLSFV